MWLQLESAPANQEKTKGSCGKTPRAIKPQTAIVFRLNEEFVLGFKILLVTGYLHDFNAF